MRALHGGLQATSEAAEAVARMHPASRTLVRRFAALVLYSLAAAAN